MYSNEVLMELNKLGTEIKKLLNRTDSSKLGDFDKNIKYANTPDDRMLKKEIYSILEKLCSVSNKIDYINRPIEAEGYLVKNLNNRYELNNNEFHCGQAIEALIYDDYDEELLWVHSRIEHDGKDYYIYGHRNIELDGLKVRVRQ